VEPSVNRICCVTILLLTFGGIVYSGPKDSESAIPAWRVELFKFPDGSHSVRSLVAHGDNVLVIADTQSLWVARGEVLEPVTLDGGSQLEGDFIYRDLDGNPAVISTTDFSPRRTTYALVSDGRAVSIVDPKDKPVAGKFYFRREGHLIVATPSDGPDGAPAPIFVLIKNVLTPVVDAEGIQLASHLCRIAFHPDGRMVLHRANKVKSSYVDAEPLWLEGAKATVMEHPKAPNGWTAQDAEHVWLCFKDQTVGSDRAWIVRDGKTEWVTGADGTPLSHDFMKLEFLGERAYLVGIQDDLGSGFTSDVYRLEANKAVKLTTPEGRRLGWVNFKPAGDLPLAVVEDRAGTKELWLISGDSISPLTTADGKSVQPADEIEVWHAGGMQLIKYATSDGYFCGRLDGTMLRGIGDAGPVKVGYECIWFDVGGEPLFCALSNVLGYAACLEKGELVTLKCGDDDVMGQELSAAKSGNVVYVHIKNTTGEARTYVIKR
jgi:hypothetical protein